MTKVIENVRDIIPTRNAIIQDLKQSGLETQFLQCKRHKVDWVSTYTNNSM